MDLTDHHLSEVKRLDAEPSVGPLPPETFLEHLAKATHHFEFDRSKLSSMDDPDFWDNIG